MKLGTKIQYWLILGFCKAVGFLPTWFLYHVLLDFMYFMLYKVAHYRLSIVRSNLQSCFPEKSEKELLDIEKGFYRHLSEVFIDTIDLVGIRNKELQKRITFNNFDAHEKEVAGRNWIAALAHYGSWEYFMAYALLTRQSKVIGVYRPLHNKAFDMFYRHSRSRFGLEPVAMKKVLRYIIENGRNPGQKSLAIGLIADQNAPPNEKGMWCDFLNHKTLFFSGIEKIALKFGMPVYFTRISKHGRARYSADFIMIYDGSEEVAEGEITERYVRHLEQNIKADPRWWMWSHRRWKYRYEDIVGTHTSKPEPGE